MAAEKAEGSLPAAGAWRRIGPAGQLSAKRCRLIYAAAGADADICLFHLNGEFFAMDARCAHSGGPLCDGDIEDADGILRVYCPWHDYGFNIRTGMSQSGLQQQVHQVKVEDGIVYVQHPALLSLEPFSPGGRS